MQTIIVKEKKQPNTCGHWESVRGQSGEVRGLEPRLEFFRSPPFKFNPEPSLLLGFKCIQSNLQPSQAIVRAQRQCRDRWPWRLQRATIAGRGAVSGNFG
ncbi:hypothetical protein CRG98_031488 [Punica granatum]|uniref:Uncharacterized protein n=1 Tax=Punica granatum TaxID=22663 RepID=A0A2I0IXI9_PUNGR|nr:hypothetical protein CRG98_031488 [Punica granatum]